MGPQAFFVKKFEGKELCFVDSVKILGNDVGTAEKTRVCISFREGTQYSTVVCAITVTPP